MEQALPSLQSAALAQQPGVGALTQRCDPRSQLIVSQELWVLQSWSALQQSVLPLCVQLPPGPLQ
jgi:hypothetical protein